MKGRNAQRLARVRARAEQAMREGVYRTGLRVLDSAASAAVWLALLPVALALHLAGFRRLTVLVSRIGHLAAEPDSFLKARGLGMIAPGQYFFLAPRGTVANEALLAYWRPHIRVVDHPLACWMLRALSRWLLMKHDMSRYVLKIGATQEIYRINAAWAGRPPLLALSNPDRAWSDSQLERLGLPRDAWFVCVHVREPGFSPADEAAHAHRNSDPRSVRLAMELIVRRGGWCVRMGDPSMTRLDPMHRVIDYAHHPIRSARLDVALCARARFLLGNTSGLAFVSAVFGVPCALANMIPMSTLGVLPGDISIPKLLHSADDHRLRSFAEVLGSPAGNFRYAQAYVDVGLEPIENTPQDILELTTEMLDRLDDTYEPALGDDERQRRFKALLRPGHYSYGSVARVGSAFLRRYSFLLVD
jgi:putative glycosyltransferase (TIGR04372 family)